MLNRFGRELRKLRIDMGDRMSDMAMKIGKSTAFLSSIENGLKPIPQGFEETIIKAYNLNDEQAKIIRGSVSLSNSKFTIYANNDHARKTAYLMALKINSLSNDDLQKITAILNN